MLMGASPDTWDFAKTYLTIVSLSGPFVLIANCYSNVIRAEGQSDKAMMGQLLGNLLNSGTALTQNDLVGTWTYQTADCVFETENFLAKAGGEIAAASIEEKLSAGLEKVGLKKGSCKFTFNKDNTYSAQIGSRTINGQYTLDSANKKLTLTYLNGLGTMTPRIARNGSNISLLMDSDKLLTLVKTLSAFSSNSTLKTASELLSNYDGLYVGLQMSK